MENCFVEEIGGSFNNPNARKIGELRIFVHSTASPDYGASGTQRLVITSSVAQTITCVGGTFVNGSGAATSTTEGLAAGTQKTLICGNGDYYISIPNKYAITYIKCFSSLSIDIKDLNMSELDYLKVNNANSKGNVSNLANSLFTTLCEITGGVNVIGNLENFSSTCKQINVSKTSVYGDITKLKSKVLTNLQIVDCANVTGDLAVFAALQAVGRTANTTCTVNAIRSGVTYNDLPLTAIKTITFDGAGGYTIS